VLLVSVLVWQAVLPSGGLYRTLSSDPVSQNQVQIRVVFREEITEKEMRALLTSVKGTIVHGPSPLGVYTVEVSLAESAPERVSQVLDTVRAHHQVRLAEPASVR
jgi:hypothetical protein